MDINKIGDRIKQARSLRNYTLDDIANDIGVTKSTIQRYENGLISKPKLPVLQAIADSLKVNPAWLSGQDVPMITDDSLSGILNHRLEELGITLEQVAKKATVPLHWLQTIDNFIPGEMDDIEDLEEPHELEWDAIIGWPKSYKWITQVAEVLGLPGGTLRAALARQEIPVYEGPILSAEEAFKQAQEDFKEPIKEENIKSFISKAEQEHIRKYRSIDEKGKHTVDTVLEMEYNRCNATVDILNAAHDNGATAEQKASADAIMTDDSEWE